MSFYISTLGWSSSDNSSKTVSRATPITNPTLSKDKSFNLIADQKEVTGSYSTLIDNETVTCSNNLWKTIKDYYWSGTDSKTVNFYAYYPASIPNGTITHTSGSAPSLACTVPDDAASQTDILAAFSPNRSGSTGTSIPLTFSHIFAAVKFSVGTSAMPSGTISKVTLNNILYKGTYSLDGTWTPNTTDKKSFSQTVSASTSTGTAITSGTTTFMMMPQTLNDASITVTYSNGGTLTKSIIGTWEAGKTYNYNLSYPPRTFGYIGTVQTYTVSVTGTYKIECWGAEGGDDPTKGGAIPGKGAYTSGYINLTSGKQLFLYVGGVGSSLYKQINYGGWNGGGTCTSYTNTDFPSGGGGSTDVRLIKHSGSDGWSGALSLRSRIMVAAGGGGCFTAIAPGANAGGLKGYSAYNTGAVDYTWSNPELDGTGATQISCGSCSAYEDQNWEYYKDIKDGTINPWGYFGYANQSYVDLLWAGGGGGGWWGGLSIFGRGGCGGSSFISGMPGCVAMSADGTQNTSINYMTVNGIIYSFISPVMIDGASSMPSPAGGTETGHSGNGFARITFVSAN